MLVSVKGYGDRRSQTFSITLPSWILTVLLRFFYSFFPLGLYLLFSRVYD